MSDAVRRNLPRAAALALAAFVAACAGNDQPVQRPSADWGPRVTFPVPPHARAVATRPPLQPDPTQAQFFRGREVPPVTSLTRRSPAEIAQMIGRPDFRRREPKAEIWQYSGGTCSLFLYFYPVAGRDFTLSYYDARTLAGGAVDPGACLNAVAETRGAAFS